MRRLWLMSTTFDVLDDEAAVTEEAVATLFVTAMRASKVTCVLVAVGMLIISGLLATSSVPVEIYVMYTVAIDVMVKC